MKYDLARDHDDLRVTMREFAQLLQRSSVEDMPEIARRRIVFSQLFREHMGREDAVVRGAGPALMTPEATKAVREHGRAMVALFLRYSDHIKCWTPAQIVNDWQGYRDAVLALQDALYERMEWEEAHLHPFFATMPRKAA
jgi:hypothetical protein